MITSFLDGATVLAAWAIALFFFRFKKATGDRLFGSFAAAFVLLGAERICAPLSTGVAHTYIYLIRLAAFLLLLHAIWEKNRAEQKR